MVQKKRSSRSLKTKQLVQKFLVAALAPYKKNWGRAFEHNFFFFFFFGGGGGGIKKKKNQTNLQQFKWPGATHGGGGAVEA